MEFGQERTPKKRQEGEGARQHQNGNADDDYGMSERHVQDAAKPAFETSDERRFAFVFLPDLAHAAFVFRNIHGMEVRLDLVALLLGAHEHQITKGRDHGDCNSERCQHRGDIRDAERREDPAREPRQQENRHEDHADNDRGVDDRIQNLLYGVEDDLERRRRRRGVAIDAQTANDVFDRNDAVVDDLADGNGKPTERHGVDAHAQLVHDDEPADKRQRHRDEGDERGAPVHQKHEQYDDDNQRAFDQRHVEIVDRRFDEIGLAKYFGV